MKWSRVTLLLSTFLLLITHAVLASSPPPYRWSDGRHDVVSNTDRARPNVARSDTIYLMGGRFDYSGRFETPDGSPDWHGWTHNDPTAPGPSHWHLSDYLANVTGANPGPENVLAYCGDEAIAQCGALDPLGGYGNNWTDWMDWIGPAPDAATSTDVVMSYYISHDTEPDYDFVYLQVLTAEEGFVSVKTYGGVRTVNLFDTATFTVPTDDYVGDDGDLIHIRWAFLSDGGWSDEDCYWPTQGAASIDDITIDLNNGAATYATGFENDPDQLADEDFTNWEAVPANGVGDFAKLWNNLDDLDLCRDNHTWQVAFIDDGEVVPGTGGSQCITWCYGPDGYVVNSTGGLLGEPHYLHNELISPVLTWPTEGSYEGAHLLFDVYRHNVWDLESPLIFYTWDVRSVNTGNPDDLETAGWSGRNLLYGGGPEYFRHFEPISDLLAPGRTHLQILFEVVELGWIWGWFGNDATPAPYFDNVTVTAFDIDGPAMAAREIDLAQDTFPEQGFLDHDNLQTNWCRFDMAQDIDPGAGSAVGDSVVVEIVPSRLGAELTDPPRLHYLIATNPLFNDVRGAELGTPDAQGRISGYVEGQMVVVNGNPIDTRWAFDLPDTGHFYPGDELRYFFWARDAIGGTEEPEVALLPADTTGFSRFSDPMVWEQQAGTAFTTRFLPTLYSAFPGSQPAILFWNDAGHDGREEWFYALKHCGLIEGEDYDTYATNSPASGVGNGLGGRATVDVLQYYDILLYTCGNVVRFTITPPDPESDPGDDIGVLEDWLTLGDKNAFFTGDNLATDLGRSDEGVAFLRDYLHLAASVADVRPFIDNQLVPLILPTDNNPVFATVEAWIADGGCPVTKTFDGVTLLDDVEPIAVFATADGEPGEYLYPAATYAHDPETDNKTIYLPYDLTWIRTPPVEAKTSAPLPARAKILQDVLFAFGQPIYFPIDVPAVDRFAATCFPNPFNPRTTIAFTLPAAGPVSVKIYDVRGALVRTLLDGAPRPRGNHEVVWPGDDDRGASVASGVYFYEVSAGGEKIVAKLALVR